MWRELTPRYWPTWCALGLLWLATHLPYSRQLKLGRRLGGLMQALSRRRRSIAATNLRLCFPDLDTETRERLLTEHFQFLGMGFMETALSWWKDDAYLNGLVRVSGREHLDAALSLGRGVLIVAAHFTTLEIGARLLALQTPLHPVYRPHNNPAFERIQGRARSRLSAGAIPRSDFRTMVRVLRGNGCLWYAPDQDFGRKNSVFANFFDIPAATLTATSRLARLTGAAVIPMTQERLPAAGGYRLILEPALQNFPGDNETADAARLNGIIERWARARRADYLWVHRRFKTRPPGEASFYETP